MIRMTLPYPPSANRYWRTFRGRTVVSAEAKKYKKDVSLKNFTPLVGPVALTVRMYRPQKSGDLDNRLKVLCDALNGHAWHDDKQVEEIHAYRHDDKANPRVEVEVRALGVEGVLEPLTLVRRILEETGHVVTPAYQKAQTEAVAPKKRRASSDPPEYDGTGAREMWCKEPETYDSVFGPALEPPTKRRKP